MVTHVDSLGSKLRYSIRKIFLNPRDSYTPLTASRFLCLTKSSLMAGVRSGYYQATTGDGGEVTFSGAQLVANAFHRWSAQTIADALGKDAAQALPRTHEACRVTISLPRYQMEMVEARAKADGVEVDAFLARELPRVLIANASDSANHFATHG